MFNRSRKSTQKQNVSAKDASERRKKRIRLFIISAAVVVILAVLGISGWSVYNTNYRPYQAAALKINGVTFDMRYYINNLKLYYGNAPTGTTIDDFADFVVQQIEQDQTIIQGAKALGIEIPINEVDADLAKAGKSTTRENEDSMMAQKLMLKQVPLTQTQYKLQAMLVESEAVAQSAIARLQAGEDFDVVAGDLSKLPVASTNISNSGWVTARQAAIIMNNDKFSEIFAGANAGSVNGPVYDNTTAKQYGYWVAKAIEKKDDSNNATPSVHVQAILLATEQDGQAALDKLNAGADINELAKEMSIMPNTQDNGADLGNVTSTLDPSIFNALYDKPLNTVIGPFGDTRVQTMGGYWVVKVADKNDSLALTTDQQNTLQNDFITQCTDALKKNPNYKTENLLTEEMKDFALNKVVLAQGEGSVLMSTKSLPNCEVGIPYYHKIKIYGTTKGNSWSITEGTLPNGLKFNTSTGEITGTPTNAGGSGITVEVTNRIHKSTESLVITIRFPVEITTTSLPDGEVGKTYAANLETFDPSYAYTWKVVKGSLPEGITLADNTGQMSGIPKTAGTYDFTIQADDGIGKATKQLTIIVK